MPRKPRQHSGVALARSATLAISRKRGALGSYEPSGAFVCSCCVFFRDETKVSTAVDLSQHCRARQAHDMDTDAMSGQENALAFVGPQ
jgi:hypothetical protein